MQVSGPSPPAKCPSRTRAPGQAPPGNVSPGLVTIPDNRHFPPKQQEEVKCLTYLGVPFSLQVDD